MAKNPIPVRPVHLGHLRPARGPQSRRPARNPRQGFRQRTQNARAVEQKIGDYYASCMDEAAIDKLGIQPLDPDLKRIAAHPIERPDCRRAGAPAPPGRRRLVSVFILAGCQEFHANDRRCRSGRARPSRSRLLSEDRRQGGQLRDKYVAHVQKMLELVGRTRCPGRPRTRKPFLRIETELAKGSLDLVARRDPQQTYHKMTSQGTRRAGSRDRLAEIFLRSIHAGLLRPECLRPRFFQGAQRNSPKHQPRRSQGLSAMAFDPQPKRLFSPRRSSTRISTSTARP